MVGNIAYIVGGDLWIPCYVSVYSLLKNNKQSELNIYILSDEEKNEQFFSNIDKLFLLHNNFSIKFIHVSNNMMNKLPEPKLDSYHKGVNLKIFLVSYLPVNEVNILYLDVDTIVHDDISDLLDKDMEDCAVAGSPDSAPFNIVGLDVPLTKTYINAGVLLINPKKWKEKNLEQRCLNYLHEYEPCLNEQTAINAIAHRFNLVDIFSPIYNFPPSRSQGEGRIAESDSKITLERRPKIIHYMSLEKPWYPMGSTKKYRQIWLNYYKKTPFSDFYPYYHRSKKIYMIKKMLKKIPIIYNFMRCTKEYINCLRTSL